MSLSAQIASSDACFKLSQKLVHSLAEKYGFKFEDGWSVVSTRSVEHIQKRLKREKRKSNPAYQVKHSRTAFSFFTQKQRPLEAAKHPNASFGELSRFVSQAWKALSPAELQSYKDMETADKTRYQTERSVALANAPAQTTEAAPAAPVATEAKPKREKKVKVEAAPAAAAAAPAAPVATPAKVEKPAKSAKVAATPAAAPAATTPAKAEKPAKATKAAAAPAAAPAVAATPAKAEKPAKAAAPAKAKAAGKA